MSPRWRRILFFGALVSASAILANVWADPHVQFTSFNANNDAIAVAFLLPTVMAIVGLPISALGPRVAFRVALALIALGGIYCCELVLVGGAIYGGPDPPTFISTGQYTLAVYQQPDYPPDEEVGVVDQVCRIAPGLVFSRHLHVVSQTDSVTVPDASHVRVSADTVGLTPLVLPFC